MGSLGKEFPDFTHDFGSGRFAPTKYSVLSCFGSDGPKRCETGSSNFGEK